MQNCTEIKNDLYNIAGRLREIDKGYFVVRSRGRFEVHNRLQRGGSFCLAVPYPQLDCRTIELVRRTRVERAADFFKELEDENLKLKQRQFYEAAAEAQQKTEEILHDS